MKPTEALHHQGQSLWLDNITRGMLDDGDIQRYIDSRSVTGLTSNPSIFNSAIATGQYDEAIREAVRRGLSTEEIFFSLAIADLQRAADLFVPIYERTDGVDGWVSLEVSPLLAYDGARTTRAAASLHAGVQRPNLFVKIPGTTQGLVAIEESIASAIPVNVTLLFDADQYRAAADAYMRGVERRVALGLNPNVGCVASLFVSRWDSAVATTVPTALKNRLGLAVARDAYRAYLEVIGSPRFQRLANAGARVQRLLWASTKTKDPEASDTLYVDGLVAPLTINTMPNATLDAFSDHGEVGPPLAPDGADALLDEFANAGVDRKALAQQLQDEGAASFTSAWNDLLARIDAQRTTNGAT